MANVPLHKEAGDMHATVGTGFMGPNFQASYAAINHVFVNANGSYFSNDDNTGDGFNRHRIGELALGYYRVLDDNRTTVFEISGGYGLAFVEDKGHREPYSDHLKTNYHKFYIQPSIGTATDFFEGALTLRMVALKYTNFRNLTFPDQDRNIYPGMCNYIEPLITARVGYKYLKFTVQTGMSISLSPDHDLSLQGFPFIFNLGISGRLGRVKG